MKWRLIAAALMVLLVLSHNAFAQFGNASVGGFVQDPSGAYIPGVSITATNEKDYNLATNHVTHDFRANGTFSLPFGPNHLLFGRSSGWIARTVEGWQASLIFNANTGQPTSISASNMLYGNGAPDIVGPFSVKPFSNLEWKGDSGNYFASGFAQKEDPQCGQLATELRPYCTLQAVTNAQTGQFKAQLRFDF